MNDTTELDEQRWRWVKDSLLADDQGRRIVDALVQDPAVGKAALRQRVQAAGVTNQISNADIEKFVTLARADQVIMGNVNIDHSRHYTSVDLDPIANSSGVPRFLIILGTLISLGGFAVILVGMYSFFTSTSDFGQPGGPTTLPAFPSQIPLGFGIFFVGIVITIVGLLFRRPKRPRGF